MPRKIDITLINKMMESWILLNDNTRWENEGKKKINSDFEKAIEIDWQTLLDEDWEVPNKIEEEMSRAWGDEPSSLGVKSFNDLKKYWSETEKELAEELNWDIAAWYQPFHYYDYDWGIFIKEEAILQTAIRMSRFVDKSVSITKKNIQQIIKLSWLAFFFHEYFHHKVESFATLCERMSGFADKFANYKKHVYLHTFNSNCWEEKDRNLEEALANVDILIELKKRIGFASPELVEAARSYVAHTFRLSPPGYRRAEDYINWRYKLAMKKRKLSESRKLLMSQIVEASLKPKVEQTIWNAWHLDIRAIISIEDIPCFTVIKRDGKSISPHVLAFKSISSNDLISIMRKRGDFEVIPKRGKGSHIVMKHQDGRILTIPNRKVVGIKALKNALKSLDPPCALSQIPDLLSKC